MAFFPHGPLINEGMDLVSMSPEVAEIENASVQQEHGRVWDNDPYIDDIMILADKYQEAYAVGLQQGVIEERNAMEHLVAFHISVVGAIAHAAELTP